MQYIVIAIILAIAVFIATGFTTTGRPATDRNGMPYTKYVRVWKGRKLQALAILPLFIALGSCITSVPAGHTGVLVTFGKVEPTVMQEGVNFKLPYQQIILVDNRVQKREFQLQAFSKDIQQTEVNGSVNFTVDKATSQDLYRNVGISYFETVIQPRVQEDVKLTFSQYTAEGLVERRMELSNRIEELLAEEMKAYGIQIVNINIENIDFTDVFTNAVEAKQVAQQNKLTTQTQQEAEIIISKTAAEQKIIEANAEAERKKIAADADAYAVRIAAEAEAEANLAVAKSLTQELLEYTKIQGWNGTV
ncbi:MAG: prohibitin family protein, partial [Oscillospiraceae bacterium]|nr:prohibitin family protein [Oscillospiraceae bacterium]